MTTFYRLIFPLLLFICLIPSCENSAQSEEKEPLKNCCLRFNGIELVQIEDLQNTMDTFSVLTVEAWFNIELLKSELAYEVVQYGFNDLDGKTIGLSVKNGKVSCGIRGYVPGYEDAYGKTELEENHWYHIAFSYNGEAGILYLNGEPEDTVTTSIDMDANSEIYIGIFHNPLNFEFNSGFLGMIDEVRIWKINRSAEEIKLTMYNELRGDETGLTGYWSFNEGSGQFTADSRGINDGQLGLTDTVDVRDPLWKNDGFPLGEK